MVSLTKNLWMSNVFCNNSRKWEVGSGVRNENTQKVDPWKESLVAYYSDVLLA
jgi:hypothetical protein